MRVSLYSHYLLIFLRSLTYRSATGRGPTREFKKTRRSEAQPKSGNPLLLRGHQHHVERTAIPRVQGEYPGHGRTPHGRRRPPPRRARTTGRRGTAPETRTQTTPTPTPFRWGSGLGVRTLYLATFLSEAPSQAPQTRVQRFLQHEFIVFYKGLFRVQVPNPNCKVLAPLGRKSCTLKWLPVPRNMDAHGCIYLRTMGDE